MLSWGSHVYCLIIEQIFLINYVRSTISFWFLTHEDEMIFSYRPVSITVHEPLWLSDISKLHVINCWQDNFRLDLVEAWFTSTFMSLRSLLFFQTIYITFWPWGIKEIYSHLLLLSLLFRLLCTSTASLQDGRIMCSFTGLDVAG